jgi:hypothetical protein
MLSGIYGSAEVCSPLRRTRYPVIGVLAVFLVIEGCSIGRYAINTIGDMLASGGSRYESDEEYRPHR